MLQFFSLKIIIHLARYVKAKVRPFLVGSRQIGLIWLADGNETPGGPEY